MSRCKRCGDVNKHPIAEAIKGTTACGKCGYNMDMRVATIAAVAETNEPESRRRL